MLFEYFKLLCILMYAVIAYMSLYFHSYYVYERNSFIIIFGCNNSYLKIIWILFLNRRTHNLCIFTRKIETEYGK